MKKYLLILLVVSFLTSPVKASSNEVLNDGDPYHSIVQYVAETKDLRNRALQAIIENRCYRYLPEREKYSCSDAVSKMLLILDFDIILSDENTSRRNDSWRPDSFVFVAFKSNLIRLLSNPDTTAYLERLNQALFQHLYGAPINFNLWNFTKSYYTTDYMSSVILATLFQDTSNSTLHLAYLEKSGIQGNYYFEKNKELLGRVINSINLFLDSSDQSYKSFFYPQGVHQELNKNIYHFYVPLYLSLELQKWGVDKKQAFIAPLMLTLTYEFITSSSDYRFLLTDPENITSVPKVRDIFGGYSGASFGVKGSNYYKDFSFIKNTFSNSTSSAVQFLMRD